MDKYLTVILIFMVVGIIISWISPTTGEVREQPFLLFYGGYKDKKAREKRDAKRKRSKKK